MSFTGSDMSTNQFPVVYTEQNFKGASMLLKVPNGMHCAWHNANISVPSKKIRSVKVPPGCLVRLYEKSDGKEFSGEVCFLMTDTSSLQKFEGKVSGITVELLTGPVVYSEPHFKGAAQCLAKPGIYNWCAGSLPIGNNLVRSIWMPPGFKLTLHEHCDVDIQYGDTLLVTKHLPFLPKLDRDTSAITVELVGPIVYSSYHFWGEARPIVKPGTYSAKELFRDDKNKIFSVRIPVGFKITLHQSGSVKNPQGKTVILAGQTPIIPELDSAEVITVEVCSGPVLFSEPHYKGEAHIFNGDGTYKDVALKQIQSVLVPMGFSVTLQENSDKNFTQSTPEVKLDGKLVSVTVHGKPQRSLCGQWGLVNFTENPDGKVIGHWQNNVRPPFSGERNKEHLTVRFPDDKSYKATVDEDGNEIRWSGGAVWKRGSATSPNQFEAPSKAVCLSDNRPTWLMMSLTTPASFAVDWTNGAGSILFHFKPHLDAQNAIVMNTFTGSSWGKEERINANANGLNKGQSFEFAVIAKEDGFHVYNDEKLIHVYRHRLPFSTFKRVEVNTPEVMLREVISAHPGQTDGIISSAFVCGNGYELNPGDIPNSGAINKKGGGQKVNNCDQCAELCTKEKKCKSFECSPTELKCNLNDRALPTHDVFKDYKFCTKIGEQPESPSSSKDSIQWQFMR